MEVGTEAHDDSGKNSRALRIRKNTIPEKRRMRAERKRRKRAINSRKRQTELQNALETASKLKVNVESKDKLLKISLNRMQLYKNMSRSYWERWRWELQKRKELLGHDRSKCLDDGKKALLHIDPDMLTDVVNGTTTYVGRGSFGVVKLKLYRGIYVAVKEFLPRTMLDDVIGEAELLSCFCHPHLPHCFGICIGKMPYCVITQFEGIHTHDTVPQSLTLHKELQEGHKLQGLNCISACAQLAEALRYLHFEVEILHNDIKPDNILLSDTYRKSDDSDEESVRVVLTDFGKATSIHHGRRFYLTPIDQSDYISRPQSFYLAPEIISGESKQSSSSDIFALGGVFYRILDKKLIEFPTQRKELNKFAERCRSVHYYQRPSAKQALKFFEGL